MASISGKSHIYIVYTHIISLSQEDVINVTLTKPQQRPWLICCRATWSLGATWTLCVKDVETTLRLLRDGVDPVIVEAIPDASKNRRVQSTQLQVR